MLNATYVSVYSNKGRFGSLMNVYAPTMTYSDEVKKSFYQDHPKVINDDPSGSL